MSNPPQDENVSVRDINLINEEWRRQLVGRKYFKHEGDGFNDLKVDLRPYYPFPMASTYDYEQYYIIISIIC